MRTLRVDESFFFSGSIVATSSCGVYPSDHDMFITIAGVYPSNIRSRERVDVTSCKDGWLPDNDDCAGETSFLLSDNLVPVSRLCLVSGLHLGPW